LTLDDAVTREFLRLCHGCLDAVDEVKRRLGVPALRLRPVSHDDHVVDPARRLPVPAVRQAFRELSLLVRVKLT
jgi:hypothetical protein